MRPRSRGPSFTCTTCEITISSAPVFHVGLAFCCAGCVANGPCTCSYDFERDDDFEAHPQFGSSGRAPDALPEPAPLADPPARVPAAVRWGRAARRRLHQLGTRARPAEQRRTPNAQRRPDPAGACQRGARRGHAPGGDRASSHDLPKADGTLATFRSSFPAMATRPSATSARTRAWLRRSSGGPVATWSRVTAPAGARALRIVDVAAPPYSG